MCDHNNITHEQQGCIIKNPSMCNDNKLFLLLDNLSTTIITLDVLETIVVIYSIMNEV